MRSYVTEICLLRLPHRSTPDDPLLTAVLFLSLTQSPLHVDVLSKKKAARAALAVDAEASGFMTVGPDPAFLYQHGQFARTSAFKPWSPVPFKERLAGKLIPPHLIEQLPTSLPSTALPVYLKNNLGYPVETYLPVDIAEMQKLGTAMLKTDPDRLDAPMTLQHLKKTAVEVVPKKEHVPTACSRASEEVPVGPAPVGKLANGRLSADTEETMSNSSLSTLSGVEDVGQAEDGKEGSPQMVSELRGLWVAFERHSLGDRARQDIMREVNLLLAAYQQRHFLAGYKLLLQQRQEAEPMSCKLGSMPKGGDMPSPRLPLSGVPTSPAGTTQPPAPPPQTTSPNAVDSAPVNLCEGKEAAAHSPPQVSPVEQHKMLLAA
ncbi:hypothetical protein V5799_022944 [Amblyomma americanum]|uniref:Uncharacterized protein n=1 Tax=Amblyomma americanum TaxID=6943 RepID=A0AAQ4FL15_AMBAM